MKHIPKSPTTLDRPAAAARRPAAAARRPAAAGPGAHRTDNGPTVQLTRTTLLAVISPDVGRHHAAGRWEESMIPPLLLIGFGLLLILTGALWW